MRILLADDNGAVRDNVRTLLNSKPGWRVVAEAGDGCEALEQSRRLQPDVVILDYFMPKLDGISAIPMIHGAAPRAEIIILTVHDAQFTVRRAIDAGARGYVVKTDIIKNLVPAVEAASQHRTFTDF